MKIQNICPIPPIWQSNTLLEYLWSLGVICVFFKLLLSLLVLLARSLMAFFPSLIFLPQILYLKTLCLDVKHVHAQAVTSSELILSSSVLIAAGRSCRCGLTSIPSAIPRGSFPQAELWPLPTLLIRTTSMVTGTSRGRSSYG